MSGRRRFVTGLLLGGLTILVAGAPGPLRGRDCDVREFGAVGNRRQKDTAAFQRALNACGDAGGGTVRVPTGNYLVGGLQLRSRVTIELSAGATLWASRDPADYAQGRPTLLYGERVENVAILGRGVLRGIGEADLGRRAAVDDKPNWPAFRAGILRLDDCRDVTLRDFHIRFSDTWTVHLSGCENVLIDGLSIRNNYFRTNSDGLDPVSCRNVHISNCHIVAGDDCIVIKTRDGQPSENIVVTNCTLESIATAVKLGTESSGDFRNIHFSNCSIRNSTVGIGIFLKDGGVMERITFRDLDIENYLPTGVTNVEKGMFPIFVDIEKRNADSKIGRIRDLLFSGIQITSGAGILIQGMPESAIEGLTLRDVTMQVDQALSYEQRKKHIGGRRTTTDFRDTLYARKPAYVTLAHVQGVVADNVNVRIAAQAFQEQPRALLWGVSLREFSLESIHRWPTDLQGQPQMPLVRLENCRHGRVSQVGFPGQVSIGVLADGEESQHLEIEGQPTSGDR